MADQGVSQIISEPPFPALGKEPLLCSFQVPASGDHHGLGYLYLAEASTIGLVGEDPLQKPAPVLGRDAGRGALCLLYAGQSIPGGTPLGGLQAMLIITAVPVSVTILFAMVAAYRWFTEDFGRYTKEEILAGAEPASVIAET